ncbi:MAG: hypothetical protein A2087_05350 [Spirochaetes bacterium GWD1_61_31]|nr:MAG: hypothetical protein A2Y37_10585 [Spirochaetes bacterium GWB1_60_80]OHD29768.1 MAG: hypothetical protein A2004_04860 [Spirochaetes bacterium GWC1_61_12]OHD43467.1 MAG: hypothetical protein A2087_05350 [Spirochaetes bacterium GWD1_61_31]OHD59572.1 MAG: hypothetical protein A2Y32_12625 [Spirochaetes bacterium GWF1_60_12]
MGLVLVVALVAVGCTSPLAAWFDDEVTTSVRLSLQAAFLSGTSLETQLAAPASDGSRFLLPDTATVYLIVSQTEGGAQILSETLAITRRTDAVSGDITLEGNSSALTLPKNVALIIRAEVREGTAVIASAVSAALTFADENPPAVELQLLPAATHPALDSTGLSLTTPLTRTLDAGKSMILAYDVPAWSVTAAAGSTESVGLGIGTSMETSQLYIDVRKPDGSKLTALTPDYSFPGIIKLAHAAAVAGTHYLILYNGSDATVAFSELSLFLPGGDVKSITSFILDWTLTPNAGAGLSANVVGTINQAANSINLTVPFGTILTNLAPTIGITGTRVLPASNSAQDFSSPNVPYTVTAADGTTRGYSVNVTVQPATTNSILEFYFTKADNGSLPVTEVYGTVGTGIVNVVLPFGTSPGILTAMTPTIVHNGASVSPASGVSINFNAIVPYTVTAQSGATQVFNVTVSIASNSSKAITAFDFNSSLNVGAGLLSDVTGVIDEGAHTISLAVPFAVIVTGLKPDIVHTGASVSPTTMTAVDFTLPVTYTVTAGDASTQEYSVMVTSLPASSNNNLAALSMAVPLTMVETFDSGVVTYTATVADSMTSMTTVTATEQDTFATMEAQVNGGSWMALASGMPSPSLMLDSPSGNNTIVVRVTAQNGTTKDYTITVAKTVSVTVNSAANGITNPIGSAEYSPGATLPLTATPNPGYRFLNWTGAAVANPSSSSTTYLVGLANVAITANFEPDFAGGDGLVGTPYQVLSLMQLDNMRYFLGSFFVLIANIDMTSNPNWAAIGPAGTPFTGGMDGAGFALSNLTVTGASNNVGLFGVLNGAVIKNLRLTNVNVSGGNVVGGLASSADGATQISNCAVIGTITAINSGGGLVGEALGTTQIQSSFTRGSVNLAISTQASIGGLVGWVDNTAVISNCYSTADVYGDSNVGGLVGALNTGTVTNSYAIGSVSGTTNFGGLIGINGIGPINNSFFLATDNTLGVVITSANLQLQAYLVGNSWSFGVAPGDWVINSGYYPTFVWQTDTATWPVP